MISGRTILCLALSQLIAWGVTYYLIGVFDMLMAADLGWSSEIIHGGFAIGLLAMGMVSPLAGRSIDRLGGRKVMVAGAVLTAIGCFALAICETLTGYYAAWICLGIAMRLTLYDAAFAALARIGGLQARRPMSQITLLGGLASATFWPAGHFLAVTFGWRGAVAVYGGLALLTIPLYLAIPEEQAGAQSETAAHSPPLASEPRHVIVFGGLYALLTGLANFLNAGMSAHMIGILTGLGLAASAAVWIAALRGVGQSLARLCEVLFGREIDPLLLTLLASLMLPIAFAAGLFAGTSIVAAIVFAALYGIGNGLLTITRGTLPLILFDPRSYGSVVGSLIAPSFVLSATAPVIYAFVIDGFGQASALYLSASISMVALIAAAVLHLLGRRRLGLPM
ncbi:MFS transporter [Rhizobium rhizogenes]|uniref:MFS transporter n=1 Tax=Rhizobium rhizogenes TaxID=359 RepID=UPI00055EF6AA|nr:MFS transporter [Rhizobium rhizogenes]NTF84894.1 MFS transporter [Rhizobium rhizogenes]NTI26053.1 MFS transporter [Rhizobium rhizogenes]NTI65435.1 MFS transporter [Rhizobium rhizogenes]QTG09139.1 MFS transporter [Rhizobium rhizogenes]